MRRAALCLVFSLSLCLVAGALATAQTPPAGSVLTSSVVFDRDLVVPAGFAGDVLTVATADAAVDGMGYSIVFEDGVLAVGSVVAVLANNVTVRNLHVELATPGAGQPLSLAAGVSFSPVLYQLSYPSRSPLHTPQEDSARRCRLKDPMW